MTTDLLDGVDRDRLVADLVAMIAIPSINPFDSPPRPGFRERELGEFFADRLAEMGMEVGSHSVVPGRPNVWGSLGGSDGRRLMLCGHLDTVGIEGYPDGLAARVESDRVYGRGACDMKAGLATFLEAVRVLASSGISLGGQLIVAALADEEHQMIGSKSYPEHGPMADFGILAEPTGLTVAPAHKGQVGYLVRTFGTAAHSSRPEEGVNAIRSMARLIEALGGYAEDLSRRDPHPLCGHGRSSPNVIRGGTILSTIPDHCELELDRRTLPGETAGSVRVEFEALLEELQETDPRFRYDLEGPILDLQPLDTPIDSAVVQSVLAARRDVTGQSDVIGALTGATDAPNLGFPCVIFGPGSTTQAHTAHEFVEVDQMVVATRVLVLTIVDMLGSPEA